MDRRKLGCRFVVPITGCGSMEVVKKKLEESPLVFENLQWNEIALYLRYNMELDDVAGCGFSNHLPTRKYDRRPPIFTRSGTSGDKKIRHQPWIYKQEPPDETMERKMFCAAVAVMIKRTMRLHDFKIDVKIYRQSEGGAIGMDLTGVVSDIYMCEWDKQLIVDMRIMKIEAVLFKR